MRGKTLYLTDLDGTLLTPQATLSDRAARCLCEALTHGALVSFATARSYTSAGPILAAVPFVLPAAVYNGACLIDAADGRSLRRHIIQGESLRPLLAAASALQSLPVVYAVIDGRERASYLQDELSQGVRGYVENRLGDPRLRPVQAMEELLAGEVYYVGFIDQQERLDLLLPRLTGVDDLGYIYQQDTYDQLWWLELYHRQAGKSAAAQEIKQRTGAEQLIVFGDNLNDLPMFAVADIAVATATAHKEVRAAADVVLAEEDAAVAQWILRHHMATVIATEDR